MTQPGRYLRASRGVRSQSLPGFQTPYDPDFEINSPPLSVCSRCCTRFYVSLFRDHIVTAKSLAYLDRHAFTTKIIDSSQGTDMASVEQIIGNEIHAPALIHRGHGRPDTPVPGRPCSRWRFDRRFSPSRQ